MKLLSLLVFSTFMSSVVFGADSPPQNQDNLTKQDLIAEYLKQPLELRTQNNCNNGYGFDCTALGEWYASGYEKENIKKDTFKAFEYTSKGCDLLSPEACYNLGVMYSTGSGVKQDYFKAVELYKKACASDYASGCYNLGVMYFNGHGVRQSKTEALSYYGKACDLKDQDGCDSYAKLNTSK